jgi:hypothetical protein
VTIDLYPPTTATQVDWIQVVTRNTPRTATDPEEVVVLCVHLSPRNVIRVPLSGVVPK